MKKMKITLTGSLGNIGKPLTEQLVAAGHDITVITSTPGRQREIEALGAKAAVGSVADADFLASTFRGADAVFAMTPPNFGGSNVVANTVNAGKALAAAIKASGVKRVVMLSSIGAHLPEGNGPIKSMYHIEQLYNELDAAFVFLRAGYFFTNYYGNVEMIRGAGILGSNHPGDTKLTLVHPRDIAAAAAEELQRDFTGKAVRYIVGDVRTGAEIAKALGAAAGKPELPWVEFTDEQALEGMIKAGVPAEIAGLYTEMGAGFRNGKIPADFEAKGSPVTGKIKLEDFAKEFGARL